MSLDPLLEFLENSWQENLDPKDLLLNLRKKAWDRFQQIGLPKPKQEAFQYMPLQKLAFPKLAERKKISSNDIAPYILPECKDSYLVFVDGFFEEALSQVPSPIVCLSLSDAMRSYGLFLQNRFARAIKDETDPFAALNAAFQTKGAFLYMPPMGRLAKPLQILHLFLGEEKTYPRVQLYLGKEAKLQLVQTCESRTKTYFSNSAFDSVLDEGAELTFCDAQTPPPHSSSFLSVRASLKRDSRFRYLSFTKGASMLRSSLKVQLAEENAEAELIGLAQLENDLQSHVHAHVEHAAPHARSRQHFKAVLKDKSRSSFEGKILVQPIAQKTEAYQLNNNLILSDDASANAKPNLEIFADDVKASHGATTMQLDEESLFYLRSRGLPLAAAKKWLVDGFCREITDHIPLQSLKNKLQEEG